MRWKISNNLHAGDVIYERLSFTYGCIKLRVLSEPVETVLDDRTKAWDFNVELLEKRIYIQGSATDDTSIPLLDRVETFDEENRYRSFRSSNACAQAKLKLHKKNPFELTSEETDILILPPYNPNIKQNEEFHTLLVDYTPHCHYSEVKELPEQEMKKDFDWKFWVFIFGLALLQAVCFYFSTILGGLLLFLIILFVVPIALMVKAPLTDIRKEESQMVKNVLKFDFGDDFRLLRAVEHDYIEYLFLFPEISFKKLKEHLESIPAAKQDLEHRFSISHEYHNDDGEDREGFTLIENGIDQYGCGSVQSILVDYRARTLKYTFVIY